jgi:hypothetical protein
MGHQRHAPADLPEWKEPSIILNMKLLLLRNGFGRSGKQNNPSLWIPFVKFGAQILTKLRHFINCIDYIPSVGRGIVGSSGYASSMYL